MKEGEAHLCESGSMKTIPILSLLYSVLLHLYPGRFRDEFGEEMQAVFEHAIAEAASRGVGALVAVCMRELFDLPGVLLKEHARRFRQSPKEVVEMSFTATKSDKREKGSGAGAVLPTEGPAGWREIVLSLFPFVLAGLAFLYAGYDSIVSKAAAYGRTYYALGSGISALLVAFVILFLGLGIGWAKGFPRWAFPYAGMVLLFPLVFGGLAINALPIVGNPYQVERQNLEGWAWLPLFIVVAAVLIRHLSVRPLLWPFVQVWHDWTKLSFLLFGSQMVLYAAVGQDAIAETADLFSAITVTVAFCIGALAYLRSQGTWRRVALLQVGLAGLMLLSFISTTNWGGTINYLGVGLWLGLLFLPSLLSLARRRVEARRAV